MITWTYRTNENKTARSTLGKMGDNMLFFVGINPSTAHPEHLDRTVSRVEKFATGKDYDSWAMLNIYAQRATSPGDIHKDMNSELHEQNLRAIRQITGQVSSFDICAGWGVEINRRSYMMRCLRDMAEILGTERRWWHLGKLTKEGHPRHPLYLRSDSSWQIFDIKSYLENNLSD